MFGHSQHQYPKALCRWLLYSTAPLLHNFTDVVELLCNYRALEIAIHLLANHLVRIPTHNRFTSAGSALAIAILRNLSGRASLTFATTHYSEVKEEAESNPVFSNAAVAFDIETLKPLYRFASICTGRYSCATIRIVQSSCCMCFLSWSSRHRGDIVLQAQEKRTEHRLTRACAFMARAMGNVFFLCSAVLLLFIDGSLGSCSQVCSQQTVLDYSSMPALHMFQFMTSPARCTCL